MNIPQTILLVDEDPQVRGVMANTLRQLGYRITEAHSVAEARSQAAHSRPALILMDRGVAGAHDIVSSLREDPVVAHIPVLMTCARQALLS
jgi:CheY-like chemotaxis protein